MKTKTMMNYVKRMSGKQKLLTIGMVALLTIGALGAMGEFSGKKNGIISNLAETVGLKKKEIPSTETNPPQTPPQLSKEYIYAGSSRMLATEDYGIAPPNPTPTP